MTLHIPSFRRRRHSNSSAVSASVVAFPNASRSESPRPTNMDADRRRGTDRARETTRSAPERVGEGARAGDGMRIRDRWAVKIREVKGRLLSLPLPLLLSQDERQVASTSEPTNFEGHNNERVVQRPARSQSAFSFNLFDSPLPSPGLVQSIPPSPRSQAALTRQAQESLAYNPWETNHWRGPVVAQPPSPPLPTPRRIPSRSLRSTQSEHGSISLRPQPQNAVREAAVAKRRGHRRGGSLGEFEFELGRRSSAGGSDWEGRSIISTEMLEAFDEIRESAAHKVQAVEQNESLSSEAGDQASPLPIGPPPLHRRTRLRRKQPPPLDELALYARMPLPQLPTTKSPIPPMPTRPRPEIPTFKFSPLPLSHPSTPPPSPPKFSAPSLIQGAPFSTPLTWPPTPDSAQQSPTFISQIDGNFNILFRSSRADLATLSEDSISNSFRRRSESMESSVGDSSVGESARGRRKGMYQRAFRESWHTFGRSDPTQK
ncbi:hypothetical protein P7C70_g964, partial [Phenoliferia sp. Uapishka_3]